MKDCVVTGMGLVSALGFGVETHFRSLVAGRSGIRQLGGFDSTGFRPVHVGEVDLDALRTAAHNLLLPVATLTHKKELLAAIAMSEAWRDAIRGGFDPRRVDPLRIGVVLGTGLFFGPEPVDWMFADREARPIFRILNDSDLVHGDRSLERVVEICGAKGRMVELNSACAASGHALGLALLLIRGGHCDVAVAAGVDAMINPIGIGGFQILGATSIRNVEPHRACRPFDANRDGTVIGEGAAVLIVEREDRVAREGRPAWGFIEGAGFSADGHSVTAPHAEGAGAARAMRAALASARREPREIHYLNAHGTGTRLNDVAEVRAIREVFRGEVDQLWISSTKPMTGHLVAAAGTMEAAITLLTLNSGIVFPTLNLMRPDPALGLDFVPNVARRRQIECAISNSFGLGGQNSSVVLSPPHVRRPLPDAEIPQPREEATAASPAAAS